jgi:hypothetical protein
MKNTTVKYEDTVRRHQPSGRNAGQWFSKAKKLSFPLPLPVWKYRR